MSASSEDTSDSGFYQLHPQGANREVQPLSPRPSPRAIRRLSNMTESTDAEDIDFFLKVVSEFRDYVAEKIDQLEEQYKINENQQKELQQILKNSEEGWTARELSLAKDCNHMVSLLHKQKSALMEQIKKQRGKCTDSLREKMDVCRRNMKTITGVLSFAKRVKNEKDDTLREETLKELKQRFVAVSRNTSSVIETTEASEGNIVLDKFDDLKRIIEKASAGNDIASIANDHPPIVLAPASSHDVSKNTIVVRWSKEEECEGVTYKVFWKIKRSGKVDSASEIKESQYVISDLPPNSEILVQVQRHSQRMKSGLSPSAFFKTLPHPAKFHLDADTANSKLQMSQDLYSVYYPGESAAARPRSPCRFSFALNVLGNISFFSGRHYWEVLVNVDGWAIGVAYHNVPRNSFLGSNDSSWILHFNPAKREYKVRHAGESVDVTFRRKKSRDEISRVGIYLDYEAGIISFIDCHHMEILHTRHNCEFREPICAALNPFYHGGVLTLLTGLDVPEFNIQDQFHSSVIATGD